MWISNVQLGAEEQTMSDDIRRMAVNDREYEVVCLLGKGKGGYSYLVKDGSKYFVLKQIHHEPCDYYQFGNKLESELRDYEHLRQIGIPMPQLIDVDVQNERILKEYIPGPTAAELVEHHRMKRDWVEQVEQMCELLYAHHTNIDYYPTNFVLSNEQLFYVDYECNAYMDEWNFENWGKQYWTIDEDESALRILEQEGIEIREASPGDAEAFIEYFNRVGGETDNMTFGAGEFSPTMAEEMQYLEKMHQDDRSVQLIAWKAGKIIGDISLTALERRMQHRSELGMAVLRDYWHKGIGGLLLKKCIEYARSHGVEIIHLEVRSDNRWAIHLYEKYGFKRIGTFPAFFKIDGRYYDFEMMCLDLRTQNK